MSSMKRGGGFGMLMAMALMGGAAVSMNDGKNRFDPNNINLDKPIIPPPAGSKRFFIDGEEVWALNEKNARRKAAKNKK